jgi:hypothetical protein
MSLLADTIVIKSDQLNGDDLIAGPITIKITKIGKKKSDSQQPISVHYEGDNGKPWKPCLTMRKLLLAEWGDNVNDCYIGRKLRLFRDETVKWAGREEGGIRISHMSNITSARVHLLTETRGVKKPHTVKPLVDTESIDVAALKKSGLEASEKGLESLKAWWSGIGGLNQNAVGGAAYLDELKTIAAKYSGSQLPDTEKHATDEIPEV